jgi:hypothetical protein
MDSVGEVDSLECLSAQIFDRGTVGVEQRKLHVLQGAGSWQKMKRLEDKADFLVSNTGLIVYAQSRDILTIKQVVSYAGLIKESENVHHGGLARSGGAYDRDELPAIDPERDVHQSANCLAGGPRICFANAS